MMLSFFGPIGYILENWLRKNG